MRRWMYLEFWWAFHNLVAHPLSQIVWWASLFGVLRTVARCGDWIHDASVPDHRPEEGRG